MKNIFSDGRPPLPSHVVALLPEALVREIGEQAPAPVEELRLMAERRAVMVCGGRNLPLSTTLSRGAIESILLLACGGSLYAYAEDIRNGFVTTQEGVRIGIAGRAVVEEGRLLSVRDIRSLCLRIPGRVAPDVTRLSELIRTFPFPRGLLLYAPPGGGKTTVLRRLSAVLSCGHAPLRVVVVDTRGELAAGLEAPGLCLDILSGYPRGPGLALALRSLSPQVLVCDEISEGEADGILRWGLGGAALLASAHGSDLPGLLRRPDLAALHKAGVFGAYVGLRREAASLFDITLYEEAVL